LEHSITFATIEAQAQNAKIATEEEFRRELKANHISSVDVKASCAIIAAVGDGMSSTAGVSRRFFSALGNAKINLLAISQGCSKCKPLCGHGNRRVHSVPSMQPFICLIQS
jgi:aspartokinase/homoserine dehydrogenase 1